MLRNRNSFFQEAQFSAQNFMPNMPMYNQMPYSAAQASQSYYSGAYPNQNANYSFDDYENKIAKLERQINRLDARITKLENNSKLESVDINSNMYML